MATPSGFSTPNAGNVYIPVFDGSLIVGFSRNPKSFKWLNAIKMKPVKKMNGFYLNWSASNGTRVIDGNRYRWNDNQRRNQPVDEEEFKFAPYACARYTYPWLLGDLTADQAEFDVADAKRKSAASKLMTARAMRISTAVTTTSNWAQSTRTDMSANHYSATASLTGVGDMSAGSSTDPRIKRALNYAQVLIAQDTVGQVSSEPSRLLAWMNPNSAKKLSESQEYHDYLKGSPAAAAEVEGQRHANAKFGLPSSLYGVEILVDDTVKTTSDPGATTARSFTFPDDTLALVTREGELEGELGGENFSTVSLFHLEDMTTEETRDPNNYHRILEGAVTENVAELITCPHSGYLFTSIFTD